MSRGPCKVHCCSAYVLVAALTTALIITVLVTSTGVWSESPFKPLSNLECTPCGLEVAVPWIMMTVVVFSEVFSLLMFPCIGQFLSVNGSVLGGPWVTSPWLRGGRWLCSLDMSIFLHPQQSGRYTVWLIERDKKPSVLLTTDTPRSTGWVALIGRRSHGARK